jgi:signal recognition particle receptor subunit beta
MSLRTGYKTFTFLLDHPTLLDGFTRVYLEEMRSKFELIETIKHSYLERMHARVSQMTEYALLADVISEIETSDQHLEDIFRDFENRIDYFTIMFFGTVNAGKTSMICDLSQSNPVELTTLLSNAANFDPLTDGFVVGPNVATMNLYEILIPNSGLRLVDVPGIGGVVHDNSTLAPFVDMADCIVFLIDSNNDITKNDYNFLVEHVSGIHDLLKSKKHLVEEGNEKNVLVVLNKWENAHGKRPPASAEVVFEKKKNWILHGDEQKDFKGISELFSNPPIVVKATTAQRDEESGETFNDARVEEAVEALRQLFFSQGAYTRLNRPRKILLKELGDMQSKLLLKRTSKAMEGMSAELGKYQSKIGVLDGKLKFEMPRSLGSIERIITLQIHAALKKTMEEWEPDVSWSARLRLAVPKWAADWFNAENMGREAVQKELKQVWEVEFKDKFQHNLDTNTIATMATNEIKGMVQQISLYFRSEFVDASPELKEKLTQRESTQGQGKSFNVGDSAFSMADSIDAAVKKVEDQVTSSVISLITIDAILAVTLGAFLTPVGSLALLVARRLWQGKREKKKVKGSLENDLYDAAQEIAAKIRLEIETTVNAAVAEMTNMYMNVIAAEMDNIKLPLQLIDEAVNDIIEHRAFVEQLKFEEL